jgi:hypothetical protein
MKTKRQRAILFSVLVALGESAIAKDFTAFEMIQEGNRLIGEQSKDKVIQASSDKSVGGLAPTTWHVVYYDKDATFHIRSSNGLEQTSGVLRIQLLAGPKLDPNCSPLPKQKLKIDSDKALQIAIREPSIKKLTLRASRLVLERRSLNDETPVWKIRLWAAKVKNPNDNVEVGEVIISAEDAAVLKTHLDPDRVN